MSPGWPRPASPAAAKVPQGLSAAGAQLYNVLHGIAAQIWVIFGARTPVELDGLLSAALTAHAVSHYTGCGYEEALEAHDLPIEAAAIAERLTGLTMPQTEAIRLILRNTAWSTAHDRPKAPAPANDAGPG